MKAKTMVFAAAAAFAAAAGAATKIAAIDMILLVKSHSSYETNKNLLSGMEKDFRKSLDEMRDELDKIQDEGRKAADELKNPILAASAKEKAEKDLYSIQQRYVALQQKMRSETMQNQKTLADMEARLLKSQTDDLRKKVAEFAKKNGYDLVIDSSAALYIEGALDATDAMLEFMGVDPKAARAKEKDEGK